MNSGNCIIVGASHAGTTLALQLRREGWEGDIVLVSAETELPYHRPPLSKDLLAGVKTLEQIRLRPEKVFVDSKIDLRLDTRVSAIEPDNKQIKFTDGESMSYDKLVLCTGAVVRRLDIAEGLPQVFYIRSHEDTSLLAQQLVSGKRAVVIGAGYIGLEAAAVLRQQGLDVTVLEMAERVLQRVTSPEMSSYMTSLHDENGVNIITSARLTSIEHDGSVHRVRCEDGSEFLADLLIVGIGVLPETELAQNAGLAIGNGVVVNQFGETSVTDIYAAGDCSQHPSALYDRNIRLESVQNANDQARAVAANITGKETAYDAVPWFWSDQYNTKLQMVGLSDGYDAMVRRGGDDAGDGFALFYMKNGVVIAADCVARPKEFMAAKQLVKSGSKITPERLADEDAEPKDFLT